jgi:hypothetical protein
MTEPEWLACCEPGPMLEFLVGHATERQLRLFACGCVRVLGHLLPDEKARRAFFVAERYADGLADPVDLARAQAEAHAARHQLLDSKSRDAYDWRVLSMMHLVHEALIQATGPGDAWTVARSTSRALLGGQGDLAWSRRAGGAQCNLLRDLFGNPYRRPAITRRWLRGPGRAAVGVARSIYDERSFDELAILADALEDAGCPHEALVRHCREPGDHGRGCWVVDALLAG